ncbi:MAG: dihydroorotase [Candidatus Caenarcaniphilales bacterium]|nr:dihydroorotase [Candidatus Caenarcaniphilales bacterium]
MLIIKNGLLINPTDSSEPKVSDLWIEQGKIVSPPSIPPKGGKQDHQAYPRKATVIDAEGKWVTPGLIDTKANFCDPGFPSQETIASGSRAAAAGGFTHVCLSPLTEPVVDNVTILEYLKSKAQECGLVDILPIAAASKNLEGKEITEFQTLFEGGAVAFGDFERSGMNSFLFKVALQYTASIGAVFVSQPFDRSLQNNGQMNEGKISLTLGLSGMPAEGESCELAKQLEVIRALQNEGYKARVHFVGFSGARSVELIRQAKRDGLHITAGVAAHYLSFTEEDIAEYNTNFKVNPPFRTAKDKEALFEGILDGTIENIYSDHQPQKPFNKDTLFDEAPFGISSLETTFLVTLEELFHKGKLKPKDLIKLFTLGSCKALGLPETQISLLPGSEANVIIIDPNYEWTLNKDNFHSKSLNTPFLGHQMKDKKFKGKVTHTIKNGRIVFQHETLQATVK